MRQGPYIVEVLDIVEGTLFLKPQVSIIKVDANP